MKKLVHFLAILLLASCTQNTVLDDLQPDSTDNTVSGRSTEVVLMDGCSYFDSITAPDNWRRYTSLAEMQAALNLPEDMLRTISTEELTRICMQYPLWSNYLAYNDETAGAMSVIEGFNGFAELKRRADHATAIIDYMQSLYTCRSDDPHMNASRSLKIAFWEYVIASQYFDIVLEGDNLVRLESVVSAKAAEQVCGRESVSGHALQATATLENVIRQRRSGLLPVGGTTRQMKSIDSHADIAGLSSYTVTIVYTPYWKAIEGRIYSECSQEEIEDINKKYQTNYPNATMLKPASYTYNCHSYAWNISEGGSACWINQYRDDDSENISKYWTNDYFYETASSSNSLKIFYSSGDHSAVKSSVSGMYESKWGNAPLMRHAPEYCPYSTSKMRYFGSEGNVIIEYGVIDTSVGDRVVQVNEAVTYYPRKLVPGVSHKLFIDTAKGEDAIESGKAVVVSEDPGKQYVVKFTTMGFYEMRIEGYARNGKRTGCFSFEPIVEP